MLINQDICTHENNYYELSVLFARDTQTQTNPHTKEVESVSASRAKGNIRANILEICLDCSTCLTTLWKGSLQRDKTIFLNPSLDPVCLLLCPAQVKLLL